jgi:acetyltransferase-like isoleucine patch superfamily enzyme
MPVAVDLSRCSVGAAGRQNAGSMTHPRTPSRLDYLRYYLAITPPRIRAAWYLRRAKKVGRWPGVGGRPCVEATDLEVGDNLKIWSTHRRTLISGWGRMRIGDRVFINSGTMLFSVVEITIGDDVALSSEVYVTDTNSHGLEGGDPFEAPVRIGAGSWVGTRAIVLPGVTIGRRVVVAAGAVVTKDVPDDSLVAGNPARVIRTLHYPPGCERAWHDHTCPHSDAVSLLHVSSPAQIT